MVGSGELAQFNMVGGQVCLLPLEDCVGLTHQSVYAMVLQIAAFYDGKAGG